MLLYENELNKKLHTVQELAESLVRILAKWQGQQDSVPSDAPIDVDALSAVLGGMEASVGDLLSSLPGPVAKTSKIGQHLSYARYYLNKHDWNRVLANARDIADYDLADIKQAFGKWLDTSVEFDEQLKVGVSDLLARQQLDSAVRKAFVLLKERLVGVACALGDDRAMVDQMDGSDLVGRILSGGGLVAASARMDKGDCEALMYLLFGLYGTFRNIVGHNDIVVPWHEAEAVISMVNWVLLKLTAIEQAVHDSVDEGGAE